MNSVKFETEQVTPSKIVCIGRNYLEHIQELGNETPQEMVIFNKPNSSISGALKAASGGEALHYEAEICFMIRDHALHGVGIGLDLTRRELQSKLKAKGLPWERAKAFDGACCLSDFVELADVDIGSLSMELEINGALRQQGGYDLMIYKPTQILQGVQRFMRLEDGDIIMTGTPKGVGQVVAGDRFSGRIKAAGQLLLQQQWLAT